MQVRNIAPPLGRGRRKGEFVFLLGRGELFCLPLLMGSCRCRYQKIPPSTPKLVDMSMVGSSTDPVEMVTVPALGPEWGRQEMHDMTKSARKAKKAESRREKFKAWRRDERGICGKYFTRKSLVFSIFGLCAV